MLDLTALKERIADLSVAAERHGEELARRDTIISERDDEITSLKEQLAQAGAGEDQQGTVDELVLAATTASEHLLQGPPADAGNAELPEPDGTVGEQQPPAPGDEARAELEAAHAGAGQQGASVAEQEAEAESAA